ncbi:MAG: NAD(P)-dependent oxidoreductase [Planctomycetia bacterium]|nr:NAD(P)-dependent oxidoreductase [Planctomycetia bacterium]
MAKKNLALCFRAAPVEDRLVARINEAWSSELNIINVGQSEIADALLEADYFCGHAKVPVDWDRVVAQGRLQWIQSSAAGMDWCLVPSVIDSSIRITAAAGVLSDQVAEHGLALILAWGRNLRSFIHDMRVSDGNPDYRKFKRKPTFDLIGKKVGIIGFGGVGRRFSEVVAPFAEQIIGVDLYPERKPAHVHELWSAERMDEALSVVDVVFLSLPLNSHTRGMFNADKFNIMKPGALLANLARGSLVDTDALIDALRSEKLGGFVADVTSPEPLPPDSPLWDMDNVLITPHVAGQIGWRFDDICDIYCQNVHRYRNNLPLINELSYRGKELGFPLRDGSTTLWIDVKRQYSTRMPLNRTKYDFQRF